MWPVLFLYPEHGETDFIEQFGENDQFSDHLETMFGAGVERPPWDAQNRSDIQTRQSILGSYVNMKHEVSLETADCE